MNTTARNVVLVVVLAAIVAAIAFLEEGRVSPPSALIPVFTVSGPETSTTTPPSAATMERIAAKAKLYPRAMEIAAPSGFINTAGLPVTLSQYIGKKVVLLDIWTYSCINCVRTIPYLNDWYTKYEDKGLVIIGIHTPEFDFEKNIDNVKAAVAKYGIKFPVVLDNDYATWNAYGNLYWPRKYLIDTDGFVRYDHIGEGGYDETEKQIQALLKERADILGANVAVDMPIAPVATTTPSAYQSIETYFGSARNETFGNGTPGWSREQLFTIKGQVSLGKFYLDGMWDIQRQYAENTSADASIVYPFVANKVYFVASADNPVRALVLLDGQPLGADKGSDVADVDGKSVAVIKDSRIYNIFSSASTSSVPTAHVLEIRALDKGLKAFTFTFGD